MTFEEFSKKYNLPEMKLLGEMKYFRYYIKKHVPDNIEEGPPTVVVENKSTKSFEICEIPRAMKVIKLFKEKKS